MLEKRYNKAQSLIETIVAIGMVVTGIVAILVMGLAHLSLGGQSAERIAATNLVREGIELIFAIRNSNWLDPTQSWPYGLENNEYFVNFCPPTSLEEAEFSGPTDIEHCTNCALCRQTAGVYPDSYLHCGSEGAFRRMITIFEGDNPYEKKIVSTVYWKERGRPHTISAEARLTDWR